MNNLTPHRYFIRQNFDRFEAILYRHGHEKKRRVCYTLLEVHKALPDLLEQMKVHKDASVTVFAYVDGHRFATLMELDVATARTITVMEGDQIATDVAL